MKAKQKKENTNKANKKKDLAIIWILGVFIAIMIVGFVNLGIEVFYPAPKYEQYCLPEKSIQEETYLKECDLNYQKASQEYNQKRFWILTIVGFIFLLIGLFSYGLLFNLMGIISGSFLIIEGITRDLNNKLSAFIALGLMIILISYFAFKKYNR